MFSLRGVSLDLVLGEQEGLVKMEGEKIGIPKMRSWKNSRTEAEKKMRFLMCVKQLVSGDSRK